MRAVDYDILAKVIFAFAGAFTALFGVFGFGRVAAALGGALGAVASVLELIAILKARGHL